jgi:phage tail-like protein
MTENTRDNAVPMTSFYFSVDWDELENIPFMEASGLISETEAIPYRQSDSSPFSTVKMLGIKKYSNIVLKKGIVANNTAFRKQCNQFGQNTIAVTTVRIRLIDEQGKTCMQWTLENTLPVNIRLAAAKAEDNEVGIESIEFAYSFSISKKPE